MNEILKVEDYEYLEECIAGINSFALEFSEAIDKAIDLFNNKTIVQEFYESGKYGTNIQERLQYIKNVVNEYCDAITTGENSLCVQTKKYITQQIDLLVSEANGYTRTDSWHARRVGNQQ